MSAATLGYAPYLRPGAILFTLIAFRHLQLGHSHKAKTLIDLYGTTGGRKRNLFGENVATVSMHAFGDSVSPADILLKHTLFGVYSRALSPTAAAAWSDALITGSRTYKSQKILRNNYFGGRFQLATQHLRSCSLCVAEDIDVFGFGQWRVLHQIPSLLFCPHHGHPLVEEAQGDSSGNVWQYVLPEGRHPNRAGRASRAATDGHATYLKLWTQLFEGRLAVLTGHAWAAFMDRVVAKIGGLTSAQAEIEKVIRRTWSIDSLGVKSMLGHQIKKNFILAELSHDSAPARLAQKLLVLGATSALGITPLETEGISQFGLDLSLGSSNTRADPLQSVLRSFLLDVGLPARLAPFLLTDQNVTDVARAARVHRGSIWRAIERIPDKLLQEIASAQQWSSQAWVTTERQRRLDKRPSRVR